MKRSISSLFCLSLIASAALPSLAHASDLSARLPLNPKTLTVLDEVMAKKHQDVEMIRKLVSSEGETGLDLAGAFTLDSQTKKSVLLNGESYFNGVVSSYAFGDLNGDGARDLAVAVELPAGKDAAANAFGARGLRVYLGDKAGTFKLFRKADRLILRRDFNSVATLGEEVFNAVQINSKTGSLIVSHLITNSPNTKMIQVDFKQRFVMKAGELVLANQREIHVGIEGTRYDDQDFENASQTVKFVKQIGGPSTVFKSQLSARALTKIEDASVSLIK